MTVATAPGADPTAASGPRVPWWRDAVIYQVYPKSFADADGDGVGDLRGVTGRLSHLAWLGVDAVWLSPFYPSPQKDGGYDVADYCAVDPALGTLDDFDALVERAHDLRLRVVVDVVPNHTSSDHPWFRDALAAGPGEPARALYHLRRGRGRDGALPPNNWRSIFGGPAWSPVQPLSGRPDDAGWWYLHSFDASQPDLDWDCPQVRSRFEDVLRFWLDRGVDGFRVDVAHGLVKAPGLPDQDDADAGPGLTQARAAGAGAGAPAGPMFDQDEVHDVYRAWRRLLDTYDGERILVGEAVAEPAERAARYVRPDEMHQAFNFPFLHAPWSAPALRAVVEESLAATGTVGAPATWVVSNHDVVRPASRLGLPDGTDYTRGIGPGDPQPDADLGLRRARAAALLLLALPGSAYVYQGDELGLPEHTGLDDAVRQDPMHRRSGGTAPGRDGCRVPLPWSAGAPAFGFSPTGRSWLPQPAAWAALAADRQRADEASTLSLYRAALRLRRRRRLGAGTLSWVDAPGPGAPRGDAEPVLACRTADGLGVVNFGDGDVALPPGVPVLLRSDAGATGAPDALPARSAAWLDLAAPAAQRP